MILLKFRASSTHSVVANLEWENVIDKKKVTVLDEVKMLINVYGCGKLLIVRVEQFIIWFAVYADAHLKGMAGWIIKEGPW